jgi:hypothetical protein
VEDAVRKRYPCDDLREIALPKIKAGLIQNCSMSADDLKDLTWADIASHLEVAGCPRGE